MLPKIIPQLRRNIFRTDISKSIFTVSKTITADEIADAKRAKRETVAERRGPIATMNDLPVPCGSWAEYDAKRQKKYNKILFTGIITMMMSLAVLQNSEGAKYLKNMQYIEDFKYDSD